MKEILSWLKQYWLVMFGTCVVVAFTALPSLFFFQNIGNDFKGLYPVFNADALYYQTRVQEIADGHYALNHPYFFEHKDIPYPQAHGGEYVVFGISKLFGLTAPALQIVFDIIAPAIIFILSYLLFKRFSKNEYTSVLFPALVYTFAMGGLFKPINPQVTLPLLLLFFLFWVHLVQDKQHKLRNSIIAGVVWGALFLTYFYHWSFLVVVIGLYMLYLIVEKKYSELKYHGVMIGIAGVLGIPYFVRVIQSLQAPFHTETSVRVGMYFSHMPESIPRLGVALIWVVVFIFFIKHYRCVKDTKAWLVGTLLLANVIYPNHQVITGVIVQNAVHWSWMPLLVFALSAQYMLSVVRSKAPSFKNIVVFSVVVLMFILPAWRLHSFIWPGYVAKYNIREFVEQQYYVDIFDWINTHTEKDTVILSDIEMMKYIPAYTHANVFNTHYAFNLPGSDVEIVERALLANYFNPTFFENDFNYPLGSRLLWSFPNESEKNTQIFARGWNIGKKKMFEEQYSMEKELAFVQEVYQDLIKQGWDISLLTRYQLDYIVWDMRKHPEWSINQYPELKLVARIGDVAIYQLEKLYVRN